MKNNTILLVIAFLLFFLTGLLVAFLFKEDVLDFVRPANQVSSPTSSLSPTPIGTATETVSPTATITAKTDEEQIMDLFVAKYNWQTDEVELMISENDGQYASGGVKQVGAISGGMWFAAKLGEDWHLVWDGNGTVMCSDLVNYPDYPTTMIPECYEEGSGQMKVR